MPAQNPKAIKPRNRFSITPTKTVLKLDAVNIGHSQNVGIDPFLPMLIQPPHYKRPNRGRLAGI